MRLDPIAPACAPHTAPPCAPHAAPPCAPCRLDTLGRAAARWPHATALEDAGGAMDHVALDASAWRMAAHLAALGAAPGAVVALIAHPDRWCVQALHAVPRTGAVVAPLNPRLGPAGLHEALRALRPALVVTSGGAAGDARIATGEALALEALPDGRAGHPPPGPGAGAGAEAEAEAEAEAGTAWRLYTSGTSGRPKTVDLTPANLAASARAVAARLHLSPGDRWHASLSVGHVGGLAMVHRCAWTGAALVLTGRFQARDLWSQVRDRRVSHASLVPAQLHLLLEAARGAPFPDTLRAIVIGGDGIPGALLDRALAAGLPLALTYGLTEASSQVANAPPEVVRAHGRSAGRPLDGVELRIAGDGEILVRGNTVAASARGPDGWLHTGDHGHLDGHGLLHVTGRGADRIVSSGVNVDPAHVERALAGMPGVAEAAVVGVPDPVHGQRVEAAVVARDGATLDPVALIATARAALPSAERPRGLRVVGALPRNANGKLDREAVRRLLQAD